jgi:hypothetical protein
MLFCVCVRCSKNTGSEFTAANIKNCMGFVLIFCALSEEGHIMAWAAFLNRVLKNTREQIKSLGVCCSVVGNNTLVLRAYGERSARNFNKINYLLFVRAVCMAFMCNAGLPSFQNAIRDTWANGPAKKINFCWESRALKMNQLLLLEMNRKVSY